MLHQAVCRGWLRTLQPDMQKEERLYKARPASRHAQCSVPHGAAAAKCLTATALLIARHLPPVARTSHACLCLQVPTAAATGLAWAQVWDPTALEGMAPPACMAAQAMAAPACMEGQQLVGDRLRATVMRNVHEDNCSSQHDRLAACSGVGEAVCGGGLSCGSLGVYAVHLSGG